MCVAASPAVLRSWSMASLPIVSLAQSKQLETCEVVEPQTCTLVLHSELLSPSDTLKRQGQNMEKKYPV